MPVFLRLSKKPFVARVRPLRGQKRLAPLAKRSTCSKSRSFCVSRFVAFELELHPQGINVDQKPSTLTWVLCKPTYHLIGIVMV